MNIPVHSTKGMSYCPLNNTFTEELSTLTQGGAVRLYDYITRSLWLKSHVTGIKVMFIFTGVDEDREGEVTSFNFIAHHGEDSKRFFLKVFND